MNRLALRYENGNGVDEDLTKAFELYEQSALLGYCRGMFNLGYCYVLEVGVTEDINKAKQWYIKAAAQGDDRAQTELNRLNAPPALNQ